jgi:hypothetical protein
MREPAGGGDRLRGCWLRCCCSDVLKGDWLEGERGRPTEECAGEGGAGRRMPVVMLTLDGR